METTKKRDENDTKQKARAPAQPKHFKASRCNNLKSNIFWLIRNNKDV
jgi:hypothetical protein